MKTLILALGLTVALPSIAHAQAAPAPAPEAKKCCCEKMAADKKMDCCKEHDHAKTGADAHAGHDMSKH